MRALILFLLTSILATASYAVPKNLEELLAFEQKFVNRSLDQRKILALKNYQAKEFSPETGAIFEVKSYWIPAEKLSVFQIPEEVKRLGIQLQRNNNGKQQVLFLVHPESSNFFFSLVWNADPGPVFEATATASSRTLMAWPKSDPEKVFFAKLSLDKEIGGVVRTIPKGEVARSIGVTKILNEAGETLPENFEYLPEFFGVMPNKMVRGGMLLRAIPNSVKNGKLRMMPLFALYTTPDGSKVSPLQYMLDHSRLSAKNFLIQKILRPFAKLWIDLAAHQGIAIEAHAQNVLMELDSNNMPTGKFIFRDFGGFNIDIEFRKSHALPMPKELPYFESLEKDYHQNSHTKALRQSLETYFEGGFLFGLGEELGRLGYPELDYSHLSEMLRQEVRLQIPKSKNKIDIDNFYDDLIEYIDSQRAQISCRQVFAQ